MAEENAHLNKMETEMKQVFAFLRQLSEQVEHLSVRLDQLTMTPSYYPRPGVIQMESSSVNHKGKDVMVDNVHEPPDPKELSTLCPKFMQCEQYKPNIPPSQKQNSRRQFTPLPGSPSQMLAILRKKGLLFTEPKRPNPESFSNYNPSKKCDYHMGEVGHSTDGCYTLKHRIQNLLDTETFSLQTGEGNGCKPT